MEITAQELRPTKKPLKCDSQTTECFPCPIPNHSQVPKVTAGGINERAAKYKLGWGGSSSVNPNRTGEEMTNKQGRWNPGPTSAEHSPHLGGATQNLALKARCPSSYYQTHRFQYEEKN